MKAGVISLYYNNDNYGGLLQSYALVKALAKIGVQGEQICFDAGKTLSPLHGKELPKTEKIRKYGFGYLFFTVGMKYRNVKKKIQMKRISVDSDKQVLIKKRIQCFKKFEENVIPHSERVYDSGNIIECVPDYDVFLCGSDQIWNPSHIRDEYVLKFVPDGKKKIAYAASISRNVLTECQKDYICDALNNFDAISVREKSAVALLETEVLKDKVTYMPDPTLLLSRDDWEELIKQENIDEECNENYILCYFLGDSLKQRRIVSNMAKKMGLEIISFPHVSGKIRYSDEQFYCERSEYECSPARFINLVKHARYVITDSFHATVFSIIFRREFVVFHRERTSYENNMISRLEDLLEGVGLGRRLVKNSYIEVDKVMKTTCDFSCAEEWLKHNRERGLNFLKNAIH